VQLVGFTSQNGGKSPRHYPWYQKFVFSILKEQNLTLKGAEVVGSSSLTLKGARDSKFRP